MVKYKINPTGKLNPEALTELTQLAANIKSARKRRKISRADMADRTRISPDTLARLEKGDPSVSIGSVLQVLSILGLAKGMAEVTAPENDVGQTIKEVRDFRLKRKPAKKNIFTKEELDF